MMNSVKLNLVKNTTFKGTSEKDLYAKFNTSKTSQKPDRVQITEQKTEPVKKEGFFKKTKNSFASFLKGKNNVVCLAEGALKGAVYGTASAWGVAFIGKNIRDAKGNIGGTIKGMGKDIWNVVKKVPTALTSIFKNSPIETIKSAFKTVYGSKFYNYCKNANKKSLAAQALGIGATAIAALVGGITIVKSKIDANNKNADIDHKLNMGHTK